jgi:uncharacterized membrane protein
MMASFCWIWVGNIYILWFIEKPFNIKNVHGTRQKDLYLYNYLTSYVEHNSRVVVLSSCAIELNSNTRLVAKQEMKSNIRVENLSLENNFFPYFALISIVVTNNVYLMR